MRNILHIYIFTEV